MCYNVSIFQSLIDNIKSLLVWAGIIYSNLLVFTWHSGKTDKTETKTSATPSRNKGYFYNMTEQAKAKAKFRQSAKWKKFRIYLKKTRKNDEVTGAKLYKGFQVHHLDLNPDNYSKLDEENFACLNRQTHDFIHWAFRYYDKDPDGFIERFEKILKKMHEINK